MTIVTPVLNGAAFIDAAISSVQRQNYADWRHIVVDGGSTDGTIEILARAAEEEPRLSFMSRADAGIYEALLEGFELAEDGILGWLNSDDLLAPWALPAVARTMSSLDKPQWISGLPAIWDRNGELRAIQALAWRPRLAIKRGWCHDGFLGCLQQETMFFRKSLFNKLTSQERAIIRAQRLAGDFALWRAFARHCELTVVPALLGGFRIHEGNRSHLHADLYSAEVKALGGKTPPAWFAKKMRSVFEAWSSAANVWAFRRAARSLFEERR